MSTNIRRQDNGVIIVEPHGRIVGENIVGLQESIFPEVKAFDVPRILINLEHTTAMSSSGLGVLIQAYKSVKQKKGRMGVVHVGRHIKNLLIVSRLTSLFEHFDTETEAVAALNDGQT